MDHQGSVWHYSPAHPSVALTVTSTWETVAHQVVVDLWSPVVRLYSCVTYIHFILAMASDVKNFQENNYNVHVSLYQ